MGSLCVPHAHMPISMHWSTHAHGPSPGFTVWGVLRGISQDAEKTQTRALEVECPARWERYRNCLGKEVRWGWGPRWREWGGNGECLEFCKHLHLTMKNMSYFLGSGAFKQCSKGLARPGWMEQRGRGRFFRQRKQLEQRREAIIYSFLDVF